MEPDKKAFSAGRKGKEGNDAMDPKDFIRILLSISGFLVSVVGFLVWRILQRIEGRVEELHSMTCDCRQALPQRFVNKKEMEQYLAEVNKLWGVVNHHEHDEFGRVIHL